MTVLREAAEAFIALVQAQEPTVKASVVPLAEDEPATECIYLDKYGSTFVFRGLGNGSNNRRETVRLHVCARATRQGPDQLVASTEAFDRCVELLASIEAAVANSTQLSGAVSWSLMTDWEITPKPGESGWTFLGRGRVEATNLP